MLSQLKLISTPEFNDVFGNHNIAHTKLFQGPEKCISEKLFRKVCMFMSVKLSVVALLKFIIQIVVSIKSIIFFIVFFVFFKTFCII